MIKIYKDTISSTQDELKLNFEKYTHGTFLCAGFQTKGHGQFDRVWESKEKENVLCSLLLKNNRSFDHIQIAVSDLMMTLLETYQIMSTFKAPNDVMIGNKKICGVIVDQIFEGDHLQATIIGIGLNVNQETFAIDTATSMKCQTKKHYNIDEISSHIYNILKRFI